MKKLIFIFSVFAMSSLFFTSCDEGEEFARFGELDGQSSVAFLSASSDVSESITTSFADGSSNTSNSITTIMLQRRSSDISSELTVSLSYTATYQDDNEFVSAGEDASDAVKIPSDLSSLTFAANSATTSFNVITVDDNIARGNINVQFEISSVSDNKYQIGYQTGKVRSSSILTVVDDDCPVNLDMLTGTFELTQTYLDDNSSTTREVEVEADPNNPLGIIVNDLFLAGNNVTTSIVPLSLITCPKTAVYDPSVSIGLYQGSTDVFLLRNDIDFGDGPIFENANLDLDPNNPADWGFYDDESGEITIYARVEVGSLGSFGAVEFNLSKVEE